MSLIFSLPQRPFKLLWPTPAAQRSSLPWFPDLVLPVGVAHLEYVYLDYIDSPGVGERAWTAILAAVDPGDRVVVVPLGPPPHPTLEALIWASRSLPPATTLYAWLDLDSWLPPPSTTFLPPMSDSGFASPSQPSVSQARDDDPASHVPSSYSGNYESPPSDLSQPPPLSDGDGPPPLVVTGDSSDDDDGCSPRLSPSLPPLPSHLPSDEEELPPLVRRDDYSSDDDGNCPSQPPPSLPPHLPPPPPGDDDPPPLLDPEESSSDDDDSDPDHPPPSDSPHSTLPVSCRNGSEASVEDSGDPSRCPSLRVCPLVAACRMCERADEVARRADRASRSSPRPWSTLAKSAWSAQVLADSTGWHPHQPYPPEFPSQEDSKMRIGPLSPPEQALATVARSLLRRIAESPPPPRTRIPFPPGLTWSDEGPDASGVLLDWASDVRPSQRVVSDIRPADVSEVSHAILKAVAAGSWEFVTADQIQSSALIFCESKRGRMCIDPAEANDLSADGSVVYDDIDTALLCSGPSAKIDLKDAFPHIPLAASQRQYWGAIVRFPSGDLWHLRMKVLWFGARVSPKTFVHTLERTISHIRPPPLSDPSIRGTHVQYVDDSILTRPSWWQTLVATVSAMIALVYDGWWISASKTFWLPMHETKALGLVVDSIASRFRVAPSSAENVTDELGALRFPPNPRAIPPPKLHALRRVLGRLAFMTRALPFISFLKVHAHKAVGSSISSFELCEEIDLLTRIAPTFPQRLAPACPDLPVLVIIADGSRLVSREPTAGFFWLIIDDSGVRLHSLHSVTFSDHPQFLCVGSSAALEMAAVAIALRAAADQALPYASVAVFGDSRSALASIRRTRTRAVGCVSPLSAIYHSLWDPSTGIQRPIAASWTRRSWASAVMADALSDSAGNLVRFSAASRQLILSLAGPFEEDLIASSQATALAPVHAIPGGAAARRSVLARFLRAAEVCSLSPPPLLPPSLRLTGRLVLIWQAAFRPWEDILRRSRPRSLVVIRYSGAPEPSSLAFFGPPAASALILSPDPEDALPWIVSAWGEPPQGPCPALACTARHFPVAFCDDDSWFRRCSCVRQALPPGAARFMSLAEINTALVRTRRDIHGPGHVRSRRSRARRRRRRHPSESVGSATSADELDAAADTSSSPPHSSVVTEATPSSVTTPRTEHLSDDDGPPPLVAVDSDSDEDGPPSLVAADLDSDCHVPPPPAAPCPRLPPAVPVPRPSRDPDPLRLRTAWHGIPPAALAALRPSHSSSGSSFRPSRSCSPPSTPSPPQPPQRSRTAPLRPPKRFLPRSLPPPKRHQLPFLPRREPETVSLSSGPSSASPPPREWSRATPASVWFSPRGEPLLPAPQPPAWDDSPIPSALPTGASAAQGATQPPCQLPRLPSGPSPFSWVVMVCRCCGRSILPHQPARFCDEVTCGEGFPVCSLCAPPEAEDSPMLCPLHQLRSPQPAEPSGPAAALLLTQPSSMGRLVARLWAKAVRCAALSDFPLHPTSSPWSFLEDAAQAAALGSWSAQRSAALVGPARRLWAFLTHTAVLDAPLTSLEPTLLLYAQARLQRRLAGWLALAPSSLASELSRLTAALREDGISLGPMGGMACRAYLVHRGAAERPSHSTKLPVTLAHLADMESSISLLEHQAWAAAVVQSYFALRANFVTSLTMQHLTPIAGGWLLRWSGVTKTRRGDASRPTDTLPPQCVVARGPLLNKALLLASASGPLFPGVTSSDVTAMLRRHLPPSPGFTISAHGIRAGTDTMLQALGVPEDIVAAWGWWARVRRMTSYYGSLSVAMCLAISDLFPRVRLRPLAPGWFVPTDLPKVPDWAIFRSASSAPPPSSTTYPVPPDSDAESSDSSRTLVRPSVSGVGLPLSVPSRRRPQRPSGS